MNLIQKKLPLQVWANRNAAHPAFRSGYDSLIKAKPYDYGISDTNYAVHYARGRMFAIWCQQNNAPRAVWKNNVPAKTLVERVIRAAGHQIFI